MMKEIQKGKKSKLLKSMVKFSNFYVDYTNKNKRTKNNEDLFLTMDMIDKIVDKMSADEVSKIEKIEQEITNLADSNDMDGIKSKLEEHIKMISQKAVEICKKEPLFWCNNRPQHEDEN